jgi:hypothetical protein
MKIKAKIPFKNQIRVIYADDAGRLRHRDFPRDAADAEIIAGLAVGIDAGAAGPGKADTGIDALRREAKALGIKSPHMMKKETLIAKIKAAKGE